MTGEHCFIWDTIGGEKSPQSGFRFNVDPTDLRAAGHSAEIHDVSYIYPHGHLEACRGRAAGPRDLGSAPSRHPLDRRTLKRDAH